MIDTSINPSFQSINKEIGRVLRASTAGFAIGCRVAQLSEPSFGSLVKAMPMQEGEAVYGLIYDMHIDDDPLVRRLVLTEDPPQSVIEDQRNNRLLPIEMSVLAIGYQSGGAFTAGLPPRPPLNLDPVYLCLEPSEVRSITESPSYLRLVLRASSSQVPVDQLLVAHIRQIYHQRGDDALWARQTITELVQLLRSDYDLLVPTLEALSDAIPGLDSASQIFFNDQL